MTEVQTRAAGPADLPDVVRLHRRVLGFTLNAQLGESHLHRLYRGLLISPHGIVLSAYDSRQRLCGFVSGTDDAPALQNDLIRTPGTRILLSLAWGLLPRPWLLGKLLTQMRINRRVTYQAQVVNASLLTIGVQPYAGRQGFGSQLAHALMDEFRCRGVTAFHLNTKTRRGRTQQFYQGLGGHLVHSYEGNDIYLFVL